MDPTSGRAAGEAEITITKRTDSRLDFLFISPMYESKGRFGPIRRARPTLGNSIPFRVTQGDTHAAHDGPLKAKRLLFVRKPTLAPPLLSDCRPHRADPKAQSDKNNGHEYQNAKKRSRFKRGSIADCYLRSPHRQRFCFYGDNFSASAHSAFEFSPVVRVLCRARPGGLCQATRPGGSTSKYPANQHHHVFRDDGLQRVGNSNNTKLYNGKWCYDQYSPWNSHVRLARSNGS